VERYQYSYERRYFPAVDPLGKLEHWYDQQGAQYDIYHPR
jgi:hypothetical protein